MGEWARGCEHSGAQSQNQSGSTSQHSKTQKRERERERKQVVISHPCSMQRKCNFHLGSTTKNQKLSETEASRLNSLNRDVIINGLCSVSSNKGDAADVTLSGAFQEERCSCSVEHIWRVHFLQPPISSCFASCEHHHSK